MNQYRLPLAAIVEILKNSTESIVLQAQLPPLRGVLKQGCSAQLFLREGKMHTCFLLDQVGGVLQQKEEAYKIVERAGDLDWNVISMDKSQESNQPDGRSSGQDILSPRWEASSSFVRSLSRPLRQIALLVDGRRSLEDIARLASKKPQEVIELYSELNRLFES
jgi:hypothetical protein